MWTTLFALWRVFNCVCVCVRPVCRDRSQVRSGCSHRAASSIPSPWRWPPWGWGCLCTAPGRWQTGSARSVRTPETTREKSEGGLCDGLFVCVRRRRFVMEEAEGVHECVCVCVVCCSKENLSVPGGKCESLCESQREAFTLHFTLSLRSQHLPADVSAPVVWPLCTFHQTL